MSFTKQLPPFLYPDYDRDEFHNMTPKEAKSFFNSFKESIGQRINDLTLQIQLETSSHHWSVYNDSEETLVVLEAWLILQLQTRPRTEKDYLEMGLPENSYIRPHIYKWEFTDETKNIIAYAALAWGEFFIHNTTGTFWEQIKKPKSSVDLYQPCIIGLTKAIFNPFGVLNNVCLSSIADEISKKNELVRLFDIWKGYY